MIIAVKDKDKVWFGTTSLQDMDYTDNTLVNDDALPIFKVKRKNIMAATADLDLFLDALRYHPSVFPKELSYTEAFITSEAIRDMSKDKGCYDEKNDELQYSVLMADKKHLFVIMPDFSVLEIDDYCIVENPSRKDLYAYLLEKHKDLPAEERILKVYEESCRKRNVKPGICYTMNSEDFKVRSHKI